MSEEYKFSTRGGLLERGSDRYGTKENEKICESCFGSGQFALQNCKACNGIGKKENASVTAREAEILFEEYAQRYDPNAMNSEVWQYNKILQWLRGIKGYNDADAKFIKNHWQNMLSG